MTTTIRIFIFAVVTSLAIQAVAWPVVSEATGRPGVWSSAYSRTKAAAKSARLPCVVAIVNSDESTANAAWNTGVLEDQSWQDWETDHQVYLVMVDRGAAGNVTLGYWQDIALKFADKNGKIYLPQIVVFDPNGKKLTQFCADGDLANAEEFIEEMEWLVGRYPNIIKPGPGRIGFTTKNQSVNATASNVVVTVTRSGGTAQGAQTFLLQTHDGTASNGIHYVAVSTNLMWAAGDSSSRSVSIPLLNQTNGWAQAGAYSFDMTLVKGSNTTAEVGATNLTVAITGCFDIGANWFFDADSGSLRTHPLTNGLPTEITWTAPQAGLFTSIWGLLSSNGVVEVLIDNKLVTSNRNNAVMSMNTVAMNAGGKLVWRASGINCTATVHALNWVPLETATLVSPVNGASFQLNAVQANTNLVDLVWELTSTTPSAFHVLRAGKTRNLADVNLTNAVTGVSAIELGIAQTNAVGSVFWRVDNVVTGDFWTVATAMSPVLQFDVTEKPAFPVASTNIILYVNMPTAFTVAATSTVQPVKYSAKGLPSGLKINKDTGEVSGTPKKVGTYAATVTASAKGSSNLPVTVTVKSMPGYVAGSFQGMLQDGGTICGVFMLTVSSTGVPSLKLETGGKSQAMRGVWRPDTDGETFVARFSSKTIPVLDLTVTTNGVAGNMDGGVTLMARPILKNAEANPYAKYYTTVLAIDTVTPLGYLNNEPEGYGYLTFTVTERTGSVKYSGKLADGTSVSGSSGLISGDDLGTAIFPIYKPLYSKRGEVTALVTITNSIPATNTVEMSRSAWWYPGKNKVLTNDAFTAELFGTGGTYEKKPVSLKWLDGMALNADGADVADISATDKKITVVNGDGVRMNVTASSGLFSGNFRDTTGKSRSFKGALVPVKRLGAGYWLLPDPSAAGYRLNRSWPVEIDAGGIP